MESFGIQVAEMANMPNSIIVDAKRKAKQLENFDYRKKAKVTEEDDVREGHAANEKTALAMEILHKIRKLPLEHMTEKERHDIIMPLMNRFGVQFG